NLPTGTQLTIANYASHVGGFSTFSVADQPFSAVTGATNVKLTLGPANIQVGVAAVNPSVVVGNPAVVLVTVAPGVGTGTPTGAPQSLGVGPLAFSIPGLGVGSHTVTAHYLGDSTYLAGDSNLQTITVT